MNKCGNLFRLLTVVFTTLFLLVGLQSQATSNPTACEKALIDDSRQQGLLKHGEHWIDLILAQASHNETRHITTFEEVLDQLIGALDQGYFENLNEKIDGSPSIVFGWNANNQPFIAYKNHFASEKNQKLVIDKQTALTVFPRSEALKYIFSTLFTMVEPILKQGTSLQDFIFQADLLFVEGDDRRQLSKQEIIIQPNTIAYKIKAGDSQFAAAKAAHAGFVVHSVGLRQIAENGQIKIVPLEAPDQEKRKLIESFTELFEKENIYALTPFHDHVTLPASLSEEKRLKIQTLVKKIISLNAKLDSEFRELYRTQFEAELRIFFNSQVRPPNSGGVYKLIAEGKSIDAKSVIQEFKAWLKERKNTKPYAILTSEAKHLEQPLTQVISAYLAAIEIQSLLLPDLKPLLVSKLGGTEAEGLILTTQDSIVKFVDRLSFTIANNQKRETSTKSEPTVSAPATEALAQLNPAFQKWLPGQSFIVMKGQPVHAGHIKMIQLAKEKLGDVKVLASLKRANLKAKKLTEFAAAPNRKSYESQDYVHVFSESLRNKIFKAGLGEATAIEILNENPGQFWKYLEIAKEYKLPGKIRLVVGQKEIDEGRYNEQMALFADNLELVAIPLQEGGLSATQIRGMVKLAAAGSPSDLQKLNAAYSFITDDLLRRKVIEQMISEWLEVDKKAKRLLKAKDKK